VVVMVLPDNVEEAVREFGVSISLFCISDPERRYRGFVILYGRSPLHRQLVGGFQFRIKCRPGCPSEHPGQRREFKIQRGKFKGK
jgi:hypothetical protein